MHKRVAVLNRARNVAIKDSSLVVNVNTTKEDNLDRILDEVAPNAILNAGGRADEVRCYPGTREEVVRKLEQWMDADAPQRSRIMWLSGPAGAGKSSIAQTVAERCRERGKHSANFFFFRGDGTRNHAQPLVATLVYQLCCFYPALGTSLTLCLARTPLICKASIEEQFEQLISCPIASLQHSLADDPIVLIVDGLDECENERQQEQILFALHALAYQHHPRFLVLVSSRAEHHLVMSFNKIGTLVESVFLGDQYRPQDDIRRFVAAKFDEIKRIHPLAEMLSTDWPAEEDINAITNKSSGQFIYAATVMRFIQYSSQSPVLSLLSVRGMRPSTHHSPVAQLDAVYSYIFSKARDIRAVKLIIGAHFTTEIGYPSYRQDLLRLLGYNKVAIKSVFADLGAIIQVGPGPVIELVFHHASLADYLNISKMCTTMYWYW